MSFAPSLSLFNRTRAAAGAPAGPSAGSKHFEALDGIRGIAILVVLCAHFSTALSRTGWEGRLRDFAYYGYIGVTLFFVLSGFLITRILVQTRDNAGYFRTFYARRSLRIFPLYYAYVAFVFLAYQPLAARMLGRESIDPARAWWFLSYLQNLEPYAARVYDTGLTHLWSLAIEEQFYLAWPLAVYVTPRRWLLPLCGAGIVAAIGFRCHLFLTGGVDHDVYQATFSRMDALLAGAAVGVVELNEGARKRLSRHLGPIAALSLAVILVIAATPGSLGIMRRTSAIVGWTALDVFFAAAVFWAATSGAGCRALCARWLRLVGKYSYGIYVLHMIAFPIIDRVVPDGTLAGRLAQVALNLVATAALTMASWHLLEAPFLRLKNSVRYAPATATA